uniref:Uncharacterized protein n=1 Tax=Arundo donax TaxID=35708 RepID=A0A0A8ZR15_ARUDO
MFRVDALLSVPKLLLTGSSSSIGKGLDADLSERHDGSEQEKKLKRGVTSGSSR